MKSSNKHRSLVLSSTFVGLVCGLVLTHQQAYAAQTPSVSNQESQITDVAAPNNNLPKTAAVNQDYSVENENIANSAASGYVTPNTYSSLQTNTITKQDSSLQPTNSDATAAVATPNTGAAVPVANGTTTSTNPGNNNSTTPATNSPTQDTGNSATTPTTGSDNPANGNSNTTSTSSEQPNTNILAQGTWGTSKWDYTQEGDDYILHLHAGTLGTPGKDKNDEYDIWDAGIGSLDAAFKDQLTQIVIDPGVIANQNSRGLFSHLRKLKTIQGLENLDTSQVTNMSWMFSECKILTSLDVSHFDTSQVTDMYYMFGDCDYLTNLDVTHFNTSQVTNMRNMFGDCHSLLGLDVSRFDTSQVTDMSNMFLYCVSLTNLDLSNFDTSQVTNMSDMFYGCDRLTNLDLNHFDTSQVTDMSAMFSNCYGLTSLDVSHFNTSQVTDMHGMFRRCDILTNLDLSHWDTSQVTNMSEMFAGCAILTNLDVSHFNTSQVTNMAGMFEYCESLTSLDVNHFDTSQVTNMALMFHYCDKLTKLDVSHFDTSRVTDMSSMFEICEKLTNLDVSHWDTSQVTDMFGMFWSCEKLTSLDFSHWDTSQVTNMSAMFQNCFKLTNLDLNSFDTSQVTDMSEMFDFCEKLTNLDVSHWDTSQVTDMSDMFDLCYNLTNLDVSHFDTSQVTNMYSMFDHCEKLTSLDVSHFDTSQVTNMYLMFADCDNLADLDVSHFDTSQVTNMDMMFTGCENLTSLDLSHFDTSQVTNMSWMFTGCKNLTSLDLSSFDTSQVTNRFPNNDEFAMLEDCTNLHHLVLGPKTQLIDSNGSNSALPAVPAAGTKIPGTDKVVTAPYWVATSGYQQGKRYTSDELEQLTGRDQVTTYDWDSQVHYQVTVESKSVTRTINVHYPDGQVKTIQDTVDLSRKVKVKADGSKTYGEWSTAQWEAYTVPELAGYQANQSKIPAQTVDSNTTDTTIDILYEPLAQTIVIQYLDQGQVVGTQKRIGYTGETLIPNYHAPQGYEITSSPQPNITVDATGTQIIQVNVSHKITQSAETLTKTRTINIHLPNATVKTYRQVAVIKRNVAVDQVTGSKTYGPWHNNSWDAMEIPIIEGYTANQNSIAAEDVTAETENETIDIFYVQN